MSGALNSGLKVASNLVPGLHAEKSFSGSGGFSLGISGAGNINGNIDVNAGRQIDEMDVDIPETGRRDEIGDVTPDGNNEQLEQNYDADGTTSNQDEFDNSDYGHMEAENGDVADVGPSSVNNINAQNNVQQYGVANSNLQGGIMQKGLRRNIKSVHPLPKEHIVCGYVHRIVYPNDYLQSITVETEPDLMSNDEYSVGQYVMHGFYSDPSVLLL